MEGGFGVVEKQTAAKRKSYKISCKNKMNNVQNFLKQRQDTWNLLLRWILSHDLKTCKTF